MWYTWNKPILQYILNNVTMIFYKCAWLKYALWPGQRPYGLNCHTKNYHPSMPLRIVCFMWGYYKGLGSDTINGLSVTHHALHSLTCPLTFLFFLLSFLIFYHPCRCFVCCKFYYFTSLVLVSYNDRRRLWLLILDYMCYCSLFLTGNFSNINFARVFCQMHHCAALQLASGRESRLPAAKSAVFTSGTATEF